MWDVVHVNENWFNVDNDGRKVYLVRNEVVKRRACKSKRFIPKVMFLADVERPRDDVDFDGKIGMWPYVSQVTASRTSRNRPAGTMVTTSSRFTLLRTATSVTCDEDVTVTWFLKVGLLKDVMLCPKCDGAMTMSVPTKSWRCRRSSCGDVQRSIKADSLFAKSKLPTTNAACLMFDWASRKCLTGHLASQCLW
ncbi:hypothetical protein H257_09827 [Aphanomyces astaci]|uniref:Uncharacterized protein n=1 Tax=Aphanomyces astaci TaxID=112090 RepID=W4G814_APHAT|nr:hypothetical protein H257_09827 [Aphanomyces astaci]ETV75852.1 hypothetical protein H257_09827 [Aphanomyces astaci]|eukprot:XP_009834494.1 hypothetical protein H257_09827 [Aphanomyces astaci]